MKRIFLVLACALLIASCTESGNNDNKKPENKQAEMTETNEAPDTLEIEDYISRARWYLANQQAGFAMRDINSALSFNSRNLEALLVLSDIYYALGDQDNILMTLNKATEIAPMDPRPIVKLAELSFLQGNTSMSNAYIDKALELSSINCFKACTVSFLDM